MYNQKLKITRNLLKILSYSRNWHTQYEHKHCVSDTHVHTEKHGIFSFSLQWSIKHCLYLKQVKLRFFFEEIFKHKMEDKWCHDWPGVWKFRPWF